MSVQLWHTSTRVQAVVVPMSVNIVIPMKNAAPFIGAAVSSALNQSCVKRVVVVDDASTDGSAEIVANINDERVTLIRGAGRGVSAARNLGFAEIERLSDGQEAECGWVMFLDADDRLVPGATQKLLENARHDCVAVYGDYERIDARGDRIGRRRLLLRRGKPSGEILRNLLGGNFIVNGGVMLIRHSQFRRAGGFDEALRYCEDWHLFCRLAALGPIAWSPQTTVLEYRVHDSSAMMSGRIDFSHCRAALERVFTDPGIVSQVGRADIVWLRRRAEAHLKIYLACQAIRAHAYGRAIRETAQLIARFPSQAPKTLAHTLSALAGL
jgi:glycosyltransferase involved in cell wall biosynthesis